MCVDTYAMSSGVQFRVNRKRQTFLCELFADWEIACTVSQISETLLQMQRQRIVDLAADAVFRQTVLKAIAVLCANHKLVVDMACLIAWPGQGIRLDCRRVASGITRHFVAGRLSIRPNNAA